MKRASSFELQRGGKTLRMNWDDGTNSVLRADVLWLQCPSALGRRQRIEGTRTVAPGEISIASLNPIGNYGVNIVFSDGHDKGVYPWTFLDALVPRHKPADFIIN